jgi:hypothetical protein
MNTHRRIRSIVAVSVTLMFCSSAAMATETKPFLSLDLAKKLIAACEAKAKQQGWKMNIAVVDDGASLDDRFRETNHIRRPCRGDGSKCERSVPR